jgi:16S rRNA C1402 N4-methylase RsmH
MPSAKIVTHNSLKNRLVKNFAANNAKKNIVRVAQSSIGLKSLKKIKKVWQKKMI